MIACVGNNYRYYFRLIISHPMYWLCLGLIAIDTFQSYVTIFRVRGYKGIMRDLIYTY